MLKIINNNIIDNNRWRSKNNGERKEGYRCANLLISSEKKRYYGQQYTK